jgi:endonuclease YncB( thermonuclease family)
VSIFNHDFIKYPELTNKQLEFLEFISPHPQITEDFDAVVVKVVDGDTVKLHTSFRDFDFSLRLLDIDTLELSEGGQGAKEWLKNQVENQEVRIVLDLDNRVGKYGRLLGKVVHNGLDLYRS